MNELFEEGLFTAAEKERLHLELKEKYSGGGGGGGGSDDGGGGGSGSSKKKGSKKGSKK